MMSKKEAQIHRRWEGARISAEALRRSGCWRDQRRSNCRGAPWVGSRSSAIRCVWHDTGADGGAAHALCPSRAKKRLIRTVSAHVSFIDRFKNLLVRLCDSRNAHIMAPGGTFLFQARALIQRDLKESNKTSRFYNRNGLGTFCAETPGLQVASLCLLLSYSFACQPLQFDSLSVSSIIHHSPSIILSSPCLRVVRLTEGALIQKR